MRSVIWHTDMNQTFNLVFFYRFTVLCLPDCPYAVCRWILKATTEVRRLRQKYHPSFNLSRVKIKLCRRIFYLSCADVDLLWFVYVCVSDSRLVSMYACALKMLTFIETFSLARILDYSLENVLFSFLSFFVRGKDVCCHNFFLSLFYYRDFMFPVTYLPYMANKWKRLFQFYVELKLIISVERKKTLFPLSWISLSKHVKRSP